MSGTLHRFGCSAVACALLAAAALGPAPQAQAPEGVTFGQIEGWWRSPLEHAGQRSEMFLHFLSQGDEVVAGVSIPDVGAWDFRVGAPKLEGQRVEIPALGIALDYDPEAQVLTGVLPESLVPVHRMALRFERIAPPRAPSEPAWLYPTPRIAWQRKLDAPVWAALGYDPARGILFAGSDSGRIHAIDARDGSYVWSIDAAGAIRARPTVAGDFVYVIADDGYLYKLHAVRATERWRVRVDASTEPRKPRGSREAGFDRYGAAPAVDRGRIYVGSRDRHVYALDEDDGRLLWRVETRGMITATPLPRGDVVYVGSHDGNVYALDARDGRTLWTYDTRGPVATDMALDGHRLLVGSRSYDLRALDARDGRSLWDHYYWFSWVESGPTIADGVVYTGSSDGASVFAFASASGRKLWRVRTNGWCWPTPAVDNRHVYAAMVGGDSGFTTRRGALVALDRRRGRIVWAYVVTPPQPIRQFGFASSPVAARNHVYAADLDGTLYAFRAR